MSWRVLAQRLLTGEFLDLDLDIKSVTTSRELSGPGQISGTVNPALFHDKAPDGRPILEEWSTALYVVSDGQIRQGGIVTNQSVAPGSEKQVTASGFSVYPKEQPYLSNYIPTAFEDPVAVYKYLWQYVQSFPDSNIGVVVDGPSTYMVLSDGAGPYSIDQPDYKDIGGELDNIAAAAGLEWVERHAWGNAAHTIIDHGILLGFPRRGRRRNDLRFALDETVTAITTVGADGDRFANEVIYLGNGEGWARDADGNQGSAHVAIRDGRLRRVAVVQDKTATAGMVPKRAQNELIARALLPDVASFTVKNHPHAPIGSIEEGDEVLLEFDLPHVGFQRIWLRVVGIDETAEDTESMTLRTKRADTFTYPSATNPTASGEPYIVTI